MSAEFTAGPFTVEPDASEPREGPTPAGEDASGTAQLYHATDGQETSLTIAYVDWSNGQRHVELSTKNSGPEELNSLEGRLNPMIQSDDDAELCVLRQARLEVDHSRMRATWRKPTEEELDEGASLHVADEFRRLGALDFGTRDDGYPYVAFSPGDHQVPLAAFILTRVLPLMNGMTV